MSRLAEISVSEANHWMLGQGFPLLYSTEFIILG